MAMSEENKQKARERMQAMHAAKKAETKTSETKTEVEPELTDDQKIMRHYQLGQGSIQDLARIYKVSVPYVLDLIGQGEMASVTAIGDQIDQDEAGKEVAVNVEGAKFDIPFTVD